MKQMELMMSTKIHGSVNAIYRTTNIPSYEENPLITCLPSIGDSKEVIERLDLLPKASLRSGTRSERASELVAGLSNAFIALPQHYDLASFVDTKIKQGYVSRNPKSHAHLRLLQDNYERSVKGEATSHCQFENLGNSPSSGIIYGIPGTGKTTSLKRCLSRYHQVIVHPEYDLVQITHLNIDFPFDGSLKTLCKNFFDALNTLLQKPNAVWTEPRETMHSMLGKMQAAVIRFNIGILVIDEFQFWRSKKKDSDQVIAFLVSLINTINLPVIFSGTPAAKGRLESNLALARRVTGFDLWDPLKAFSTDGTGENKLWSYFAQKLWAYQYLEKPPVALSDEISKTWFDCSQGILDIAVKLYIQVQLRAIKSKKEQISHELFRKVYEDDFKPIHSIIDALRSKNPERIADYPDISQSKLLMNIASLKHSILTTMDGPTVQLMKPVEKELLDCLIHIGYEKDVATEVTKQVVRENPLLEKKEMILIASTLLQGAGDVAPVKKPKKTKKQTKPEPPNFNSTKQSSLFNDILDED